MSYKHITIEERACISKLLREGSSIRQIAEILDRSPSTISREIRRNKSKNNQYYPTKASLLYKERRQSCGRKIKLTQTTKSYIEEKLRETWSPEQICGFNEIDMLPSFSTIYRYLYQGLLSKGDLSVLRRKDRRNKAKETRGRFNIGKPISKRDKSVYNRKDVGHWEADTVVSGRDNGKSVFVTLVERKTRLYIARLLPNRKEVNVTKAIIEMLSDFPDGLVKSITCDRGKEFAGYAKLEEDLKCNVYFADPYCSWQRGSNENSNGLLREFFPKGMSLDLVNKKDLDKALSLINNRPRKCIGFRQPIVQIQKEIDECCT